jgi:glycosyltransferase involved in cell wall biosynthesis
MMYSSNPTVTEPATLSMTIRTVPCFLSVVIPTYNRRDLVARAIQSVLDQSGSRRVQVIVVDDGSTDGTTDLIEERYGNDARVELLSSPRRYASAARNLGFETARGSHVCFLDSDDYWLEGTLANVERVFAAYPALAFVSVEGVALATPLQPPLERIVAGDSPGWSHAKFTSAPLQSATFELADRSGCAHLLHGDFFPAIINGDLFYLSGLVIRREYVVAAGAFNERFRYFNDWEFFARLCAQGPGAYLEYDGFRRDTGRPDQISRRRPATATARRRLFIVRSLLRRPRLASAYRSQLGAALIDACYQMGRALLTSPHHAWALRYLRRSIRHGHKLLRSVALLCGVMPDDSRDRQRVAGSAAVER